MVNVMGAVVGYDTSVIGGTMALEPFRRDFGMERVSDLETDTLEGNIVSTFQAGCFFGSLLTFPLAERFGRKMAIVLAISIFCVGGSLMVRPL
jgi:MFS family permease